MANKVGPLIKEARTKAGLTQEQLAKKIKGVEASDISKAERGEYVPTQAILKEIAKITGVTQTSLIEAAKQSTASSKSSSSSTSKTGSSSSKTGSSSSKTGSSSSKTGSSSSKTGSSSSKTGSSSSKTGSSSSKTGSSSSKTGSSSSTAQTTSMKVTNAEKRLVELYRKASADDKKAVVKILKGQDDDPGDLLSAILDTAANLFGK